MKLLMVIICIGIIWWIEYDRNSYLDSLPKEKRDELIKEHLKCGANIVCQQILKW